MGAKVATLQGVPVVNVLVEFAIKNCITKMIFGKSRSRWWQNLLGGSITSQLVRRIKYYDVFVVGGWGENPREARQDVRK
ncbi:MAG: hypothetical protein ABR886_12775 [Dehalococcoidales bacterium]|jgi:K+-sensing histidine kinase KdpD